MATLYASAELTIGWLGTTDLDRVAKALECIVGLGPWFKAMSEMRPAGEWEGQITEKDLAWVSFLFPHLCDLDPTDTEHPAPGPGNTIWSAVWLLLDLPYWYRISIFQEAVLADRLQLHHTQCWNTLPMLSAKLIGGAAVMPRASSTGGFGGPFSRLHPVGRRYTPSNTHETGGLPLPTPHNNQAQSRMQE